MTEQDSLTGCPNCGHQNPQSAVRCAACSSPMGYGRQLCHRCGEAKTVGSDQLCGSCRADSTDQLELGEPCPTCGLTNPVDRQCCAGCGVDLPEQPTVASTRPVLADRVARMAPQVPEPPVLGRDEQLERLQHMAQSALDQNACAAAIILGEPGAGKTRLLDTLATRMRELSPDLVLTTTACREATDEPYDPLIRLIESRLAVAPSEDEISQRISITRLVDSVFGPEGASWVTETAHLVGHFAGIPFPQSPVLRSLDRDPVRLRSRLHLALKRFIAADAKTHGVVWIIDDLHNASPEALALLSEIVVFLKDIPFVLIVAGQLSLRATFQLEAAIEVPLAPLTDEAMAQLFGLLLPGLPEAPIELTEAAMERAGGNPASMREIARLLLEAGVVDCKSDPWRTDLSKLAASDLPVSLEEALRARRRRLDQRDRAILERAAVVGEVFWDEALLALGRVDQSTKEYIEPAQIWPDDSETISLESTLKRLEDAEFVVLLSGSEFNRVREYAFRHAGLREQVLEDIPEGRLRAYHRLTAQWLESTSGDRRDQFLEQIAWHWGQAGEPRRSTLAVLEAATCARSRALNQKAIRLFERGLEGLSEDDRLLRMDALHDLGSVYQLIGDYEQAVERLTEMLRDAWTLVHRGKAGAALNKMGRIHRAKGDYPAARAYLERGLQLFRAANDTRGVASSLDDLGNLYWLLGHYKRALDQSAEALEIRRSLSDRRGESVSLLNIGHIEMARGYVHEADACYKEVLNIARTIGDRDTECRALNALGAVLNARNELDQAIDVWRSAQVIAEEIGNRRLQAFLLNNLGEVLTTIGDREQAELCLSECESLARDLEDQRVLADVFRNLGRLLMHHNEMAQARDYLDRSLRKARQMGSKEAVGLALRGLGELRAQTLFSEAGSDDKDAPSYFNQAVAVFEALGHEVELAHTLNALGTYWLERGDTSIGRDVLERARDIYERVASSHGERIDATIKDIPAPPDPDGARDDTQVAAIPDGPPARVAGVDVEAPTGLARVPTKRDLSTPMERLAHAAAPAATPPVDQGSPPTDESPFADEPGSHGDSRGDSHDRQLDPFSYEDATAEIETSQDLDDEPEPVSASEVATYRRGPDDD